VVAGVIKCGAAQPESTRGLWVLGYGFDRWCLGMGTAILKKTCFLFLEREHLLHFSNAPRLHVFTLEDFFRRMRQLGKMKTNEPLMKKKRGFLITFHILSPY
jgi:hypothetical protein